MLHFVDWFGISIFALILGGSTLPGDRKVEGALRVRRGVLWFFINSEAVGLCRQCRRGF